MIQGVTVQSAALRGGSRLMATTVYVVPVLVKKKKNVAQNDNQAGKRKFGVNEKPVRRTGKNQRLLLLQ